MNLHQSLHEAEIIQVIQKAFGNDAMGAAQIEVWHKHFKGGQESEKRSTCWKACNKQNPWACGTCMGCNQRDLCEIPRCLF